MPSSALTCVLRPIHSRPHDQPCTSSPLQVATGHNADDMAETVLLNLLRGDVARLGRCTSVITGEDGDLPRVKPFKYSYEKEIVMYAYFKK